MSEPMKACHWLSHDSSVARNEEGAKSFQVSLVISASILSLVFNSLHTVGNTFSIGSHRGAFSCNMFLQPINELEAWIGKCLKIYVN